MKVNIFLSVLVTFFLIFVFDPNAASANGFLPNKCDEALPEKICTHGHHGEDKKTTQNLKKSRMSERDGAANLNGNSRRMGRKGSCYLRTIRKACSPSECKQSTRCSMLYQKGKEMVRASHSQREHAERLEELRRQTRDRGIQEALAEKSRRQQAEEKLAALKEVFQKKQDPNNGLNNPTPSVKASPTEAAPEKQNLQPGEVRREVVIYQNDSDPSDLSDEALLGQIAALQAVIAQGEARSQAMLSDPSLHGPTNNAFNTDNNSEGAVRQPASIPRNEGGNDEEKLANKETIGYYEGGGGSAALAKKGAEDKWDDEELFKFDPDDKNAGDDKKINVANFLPENDPRLSFADFIEVQPYEPPLTSAAGPTLWEKLNWRYKAIEPLMQK